MHIPWHSDGLTVRYAVSSGRRSLGITTFSRVAERLTSSSSGPRACHSIFNRLLMSLAKHSSHVSLHASPALLVRQWKPYLPFGEVEDLCKLASFAQKRAGETILSLKSWKVQRRKYWEGSDL